MNIEIANSLLKPFLISLLIGFLGGVIIGIKLYLK